MAKKNRKGQPDGVKDGSDPGRTSLLALSAEELACRSQQGCETCFAELVERYGVRLFQFLHYKTNNVHDAEDLVQETFVKAYRNIRRYRSSWKFSTWLFTIAARLASSHYRSSGCFQAVGEVESDNPGPEDIASQQEMRQSLWMMARGLSKNQYQVLRLRYAEDMSIKEISRVLRKSRVNVKVLLYRARVNLGKRLRNVTAEEEIPDQVSSRKVLSIMKVEGA